MTTEIFEVQENEYYDESWDTLGMYYTKELAEEAILERKFKLKKDSKLPKEEFEFWFTWTITSHKLFGLPK